MNILLYAGSIIIILWGVSHLIPTKAIVRSFGEISPDSKKILTGAVIAEGLALIFLGVLPLLITVLVEPHNTAAYITYIACAVMLMGMAVLTAATGARTPTIWSKVCPVVKTTVAALFILGSLL